MRDLISEIDLKRAISPGAAITDNTPVTTQILDRRGADSVALLINLGALAIAGASYAVTMVHGDAADLSDATAVPTNMMNGTLALAGFTGANSNVLRKIGYVGSKRYIRATITPTGNTGNAYISAIWLLGELYQEPAPNPPV